MTSKTKTADLSFDNHKPPSPEQLDGQRHAMCAAIEARDAPEFERIFANAKYVRSQAAAREVLHWQEEKIENQRAAHEVRVDVERLLGEWLIEAEKSGLRFMGKPPKGKKIGTPSDPNLITLKRLAITKQQSRDWQKTARLSPAEFQALRADLSAGPTIVRFSATRSHRRRRDSGGGAGSLRQIEQKAAALQKLFNAPDAEDEDESLLHSLDTPDPDSLPRVSAEALREKRKLIIEGMKADRTHFTVRPYPEPAALRIEPPPPVEIPTTAAQPTAVETEPPPAPSSPHEDALSFDQLKLGVYLPNLPADVLAEYMDAIAGLVELDGGAPIPVDEQPMPSPAAPPEIVDEITPAPPAVEEASPSPSAPSCSTSSGNGQSDFVGFDVSEPPPPSPPQTPRLKETRSVPYISSARMAEIEAANLTAMLALAGAGIPAFPARLDWNAEAKKWDKQPAITGWKKAATIDPEIIRRWWCDLPRKLGLSAYRLVPGIWCGHPALDWIAVDADRHGGPDGVSTFDALMAEHEGLPVGPVTATAGGGFHYIFTQPDGKPLGNHDGVLHDQGINVRGHTGWVVAPGAVRPDGAMWRGADDAPSLIDAFRAGSIPTIPTWFVNIVRPPKPDKPEKAPKAKSQTKAAKPVPLIDPTSSDKTATKREKAWARGALNKIIEKLAAMTPNSGRNEATYRQAFVMGTMVVRGWIDRRSVEREIFSACERNGLVAEGDDVRGAIERGLDAGSSCPHDDLPDRRTKAARQQRDSTKAWKNLLPTEIYRLLRVRPYGEHASIEAARDVLAAIRRDGHVIEELDRHQLGELVRATFEEFKAIGAMFDRHPSHFLPYDATQEEVATHLAAVRKAKNPDRAKAARERRAHEKLKREQQPPPTNDLVAQRCKAIVGFAKKNPGKHRTGDLVRGLKRWDAFEGLTDQGCRNTIVELFTLAVAGKLPALTDHLIVTKTTAKNRKPTFTVEYRK